MSNIFENTNLLEDYYKNSKYFCYEYCIPIEKVIFDNNENMSTKEKQIYLLAQIIIRIYSYEKNKIKNMRDDGNPILRLRDDDIMKKEFFISKEEITDEMLKTFN